MVLAWHVCALVWQKQLPKLQTLLSKPPGHEHGRQTYEQQRMVMAILSNQLGIPLQRRVKES